MGQVDIRYGLTRRQMLRGAGIGAAALAVGGALPVGALPGGGRAVLGGGAGGREPLRLARAWPVTEADWLALASFDDTHHVFTDGSIELLLWPGDVARLDDLRIRYQVTVADLVARDAALRGDPSGPVPSGVPGARSTYRRLGNDTAIDNLVEATYYADMQLLASTYPTQCRMFSLPLTTLGGRTVYGIEICTDVARNDGRPVFYMDGLHHAREWPGGEFTIMFGFDLLESYGKDARVTALVDNVRTILVPVQNPDGFVRSRDAATSPASAHGPVPVPLVLSDFEYHRKNMRRHGSLPEETSAGVDTNRNYGFQWGGDGSSASTSSQTHRGTSPFSEPESENVRRVLNRLHAVTLNSNHTYGRLILWPPGARTFGSTPDDDILRALGLAQREPTGYTAQFSWQLYDTTGTTIDWAYGTHGTLAYTYEHGSGQFHPNYANYVPSTYTTGGVREAFLRLAEAAMNPAYHSKITGEVVDPLGTPVPATIRITKEWQSPLWRNANSQNPTGKAFIDEWLDTSMETEDGSFTYHVNGTARPYEQEYGEVVPYAVTITSAAGSTTRQVVVGRGETVDLGSIVID